MPGLADQLGAFAIQQAAEAMSSVKCGQNDPAVTRHRLRVDRICTAATAHALPAAVPASRVEGAEDAAGVALRVLPGVQSVITKQQKHFT